MVDDANVTSGLRSRRAVQALAAHDPQFSELVRTLYGDRSAEEVWEESFGKMSPDASSMHIAGTTAGGGSRAKRWALGLALAGTAAGAVAAGSEGADAYRGLRGAEKVKPLGPRVRKLVPKAAAEAIDRHPKRLAGARAANAGVALTADTLAGGALHREQKMAKGFGDEAIPEIVKGFLVNLRSTVGDVMKTGNAGSAAAKTADTTGDMLRIKHQLPGAGKAKHAAGGGVPSGTSTEDGAVPPPVLTAPSITPGANALATTVKKNLATPEPLDVEWEGAFAKYDETKGLAFGWANVCKINGELVTDHQGDVVYPEDLEDAAYDFVLHSRSGGDMHMRTDGRNVYKQEFAKPGDSVVPVAELVESMMFTAEKKAALDLPTDFPEGWWIGMKYHDPVAKRDIAEGRRTGFSIHGSGFREPVSKAHDLEKIAGLATVGVFNRRLVGRAVGGLVRLAPGGRRLADDAAATRMSVKAAKEHTGDAVWGMLKVKDDLANIGRRVPMPPTYVRIKVAKTPVNPVKRRVIGSAAGTALFAYGERN